MGDHLLVVSRKWGTGRGQFTSVERFCALLDPAFITYHGKRVHIYPRISLFFKRYTNSRVSSQYCAPYNSFSFELEMWGIKKTIQKHYKYLFFPYADYDYYYTQYLKKLLNVRIILWTYFSQHELQHRFRNLNHFKKADLILAAGKDSQHFITTQIPEGRVEFFPIGVDTDFFKPSNSYETYRIVHVGNNRRDFETLVRGLDLIYKSLPELKVDLIGASASRHLIPTRPYITIHGFLTDNEYLNILNKCNFTILSLKDGGSSNSLMETMACGLPIIVTGLPNIIDYLDDSFAWRFQKGDFIEMSRLCLELFSSPSKRKEMSTAAHTFALSYSWDTLKKSFWEMCAALS